MAMPEISAEHYRFVEEYVSDRNGTRSALAAGLTTNPQSARVIATRLLADVNVKRWVKHLHQAQARRLKFKPSMIVRSWMLAATAHLNLFEVDDKGKLTTAPGVPKEYLRTVRKLKQTKTTKLNGKNELVEEIKTDIELRDAFGPECKLMEHFKELTGDDKDAGAVAAMGQLAALLAGRVNAAGGGGDVAGPVQGGAALDAEAPANPGVPESGG